MTTRTCLFTLTLIGAVCRDMAGGAVPHMPSPAAVLAIVERAADWQMANPDGRRTNEWHPAAYYAGMMALSAISRNPRYEDAIMRMAEDNRWQLGGRLYHADDHCIGQTYAELFLRRRDPRMLQPMQESFDRILAQPKERNLEFKGKDMCDRWSWCDALFMGPPAWIRLYAATGNRSYLDFMIREWWATSDYLYDSENHLFFRDSTYFAKREANGRKIFWGRGNGWVLAGLARVLQYLPADHAIRPRFERQYREMAARILTLQQADGLWRASLLDPESYPLKETSGSSFYCYALAWGINAGLLDRTNYAPAVMKCWAALTECVNPDGRLTHVQPVGADPKNFPAEATEIYGVGAFLLAGSEVFHLAQPAPPSSR